MCKPERSIRNEFTLTIACPNDACPKIQSLCTNQKAYEYVSKVFMLFVIKELYIYSMDICTIFRMDKMLTGNGSACVRRVNIGSLVFKWQSGCKMWGSLVIGEVLLLRVHRVRCGKSLLLSIVLQILLSIVIRILVDRLIHCGYRHSPKSKFHQINRLSQFSSGIQNGLVSLVGLAHFVFSDCSAHSMPEYAALFIVSCFNFWKCNQFFVSTYVEWSVMEATTFEVWVTFSFSVKITKNDFNLIFQEIFGLYYF